MVYNLSSGIQCEHGFRRLKHYGFSHRKGEKKKRKHKENKTIRNTRKGESDNLTHLHISVERETCFVKPYYRICREQDQDISIHLIPLFQVDDSMVYVR